MNEDGGRCCYAMCTRPTMRDRGTLRATTPRGRRRAGTGGRLSCPLFTHLAPQGTGVSIDRFERMSTVLRCALCIEPCQLQTKVRLCKRDREAFKIALPKTTVRTRQRNCLQSRADRAPYLPYFRRPRPFTVKPCLASPPLPHRCAGTAGEWRAPH